MMLVLRIRSSIFLLSSRILRQIISPLCHLLLWGQLIHALTSLFTKAWILCLASLIHLYWLIHFLPEFIHLLCLLFVSARSMQSFLQVLTTIFGINCKIPWNCLRNLTLSCGKDTSTECLSVVLNGVHRSKNSFNLYF